MFLGWPTTEIAKMAPIPLSKWLQEIKIEKPLIRISHSIDAITFMADLGLPSQLRWAIQGHNGHPGP